MEFLNNIKFVLLESVNDLTVIVSNYLPNLVSALTLLFSGLLLALLTKWIIIRLSAGLDRVVHVVGITSIPGLRNWPIGVIFGWIAFWLLILFFLTAAVESLGLPGLAAWLGRLINNLPTYFLAAIVVLAGIWIGNYINQRIQSSAPSSGRRQAQILGRTLRAFVISFAVISGLSQAGMDVSLFEYILIILVTAILAAVSLAFGMGAGPTLSNMISGRYLKKTYQVGQCIQIEDYQGEILELLPTGVVLNTKSGRTLIPAKLFTDNVSILLDNEDINVRQ